MTRSEAIAAIDKHTGHQFAVTNVRWCDGAWHAELVDPEYNDVAAFAYVEDHGRTAPFVDWY